MLRRLVVAALALLALVIFIPRPVHTGPGESTWLGIKFVGPDERKVIAKTFIPAHDETCSIRTTNHGTGTGTCWIDEVSTVTLEGYGPVPVDITWLNRIQIGDVWSDKWKKECPNPEYVLP